MCALYVTSDIFYVYIFPCRCRTVALETGMQNTQLCTTIVQLSFTPEQLALMFTFPLIYSIFQLTFAGLILGGEPYYAGLFQYIILRNIQITLILGDKSITLDVVLEDQKLSSSGLFDINHKLIIKFENHHGADHAKKLSQIILCFCKQKTKKNPLDVIVIEGPNVASRKPQN